MSIKVGDSIVHTPDGDIAIIVGVGGRLYCRVKWASDGEECSYSRDTFHHYWGLGLLQFDKQTLIRRYVEATREKL